MCYHWLLLFYLCNMHLGLGPAVQRVWRQQDYEHIQNSLPASFRNTRDHLMKLGQPLRNDMVSICSRKPTNCKIATHVPLLLWEILGLSMKKKCLFKISLDLSGSFLSLLLQKLHVFSSRDSEPLFMSIWCHAVIKMDDRDTEMLKPHILCHCRPNLKCAYLKNGFMPKERYEIYIFPI